MSRAPASGSETPCRIAVNQQSQPHRRVIRPRARPAIAADQRSQIHSVDHLHHEPRQMPFRQPLVCRRRQQKSRLPIHLAKVAHPPPALVHIPDQSTTSWVGSTQVRQPARPRYVAAARSRHRPPVPITGAPSYRMACSRANEPSRKYRAWSALGRDRARKKAPDRNIRRSIF